MPKGALEKAKERGIGRSLFQSGQGSCCSLSSSLLRLTCIRDVMHTLSQNAVLCGRQKVAQLKVAAKVSAIINLSDF